MSMARQAWNSTNMASKSHETWNEQAMQVEMAKKKEQAVASLGHD